MTKKIDEISLGNYHKKAVQSKAMAQMNKAFKYPGDHDATIAKREKGLGMAKARGDKNAAALKAKADADQQARIQADKENLPALMAQYQKLRSQFDPDYEYSDDYSFWSKQKDIKARLSALERQINAAGGNVQEGYGSNRGYHQGFASPTAPSLGRRGRDYDSGDDEPQGMFGVIINGKLWKEFTSNKAFQVASTVASKNPGKKVHVRWPDGTLNLIGGGVKESNVQELSKGTLSNYSDKADMDVVKKHRVRGPQAQAGDKDAVAKTDKKIDKRMAGIDKAAKRLNTEDTEVQEWKKSTKAPIKPRNFVAKNATTGGAGAHKDKKKDAKQGKAKHKKKPELAETATYERRLNVLLEAKLLTEQIKQLRK